MRQYFPIWVVITVVIGCKYIYVPSSRQVTDVALTRTVVLSCSQDATVRLWRVDSPAPVRVIHFKLHIQVKTKQRAERIQSAQFFPPSVHLSHRGAGGGEGPEQLHPPPQLPWLSPPWAAPRPPHQLPPPARPRPQTSPNLRQRGGNTRYNSRDDRNGSTVPPCLAIYCCAQVWCSELTCTARLWPRAVSSFRWNNKPQYWYFYYHFQS